MTRTYKLSKLELEEGMLIGEAEVQKKRYIAIHQLRRLPRNYEEWIRQGNKYCYERKEKT